MLLNEQLDCYLPPKFDAAELTGPIEPPQDFAKLSVLSLKRIEGQQFLPIESSADVQFPTRFSDYFRTRRNHRTVSTKSISLKPLMVDTPIVGVDVSSIKLGETETGTLCATRGAIIWKKGNQYKSLRIGPFPFHLTEDNYKEIYQMSRQCSLQSSIDSGTPSLANLQVRMGGFFERWLQKHVARSTDNGIILWDGSLTAGTPDNPLQVVSKLLETARNHLNTVMAFSKTTQLRLLGSRLTDLVIKSPPPCLLQINGFPSPSSPIYSLGNIYVAKLTPGVCSFRLDIDNKIPRELGIQAVRRLLGNDWLLQSYPETLRLAHILSTFTANEVIGIQRFIAQRYGLEVVARPNIRRLLFGPFGKGPEG